MSDVSPHNGVVGPRKAGRSASEWKPEAEVTIFRRDRRVADAVGLVGSEENEDVGDIFWLDKFTAHLFPTHLIPYAQGLGLVQLLFPVFLLLAQGPTRITQGRRQ
jgi:hypothetical protein